jgi:TonB family protein
LTVVLACAAAPAVGASIAEALAERGHPGTRVCTDPASSLGVGRLAIFGFPPGADDVANRQKAIDILTLVAPMLAEVDAYFVGFETFTGDGGCETAQPDWLFWLDYDGNWRLVQRTLSEYLAYQLEHLPDAARGGAGEAYVRYSLGLVAFGTNETAAGLEYFAEANDLLDAAGVDPMSIRARTLLTLAQSYLADDDEVRGQRYLEQYARTPGVAGDGGSDYLPLVRYTPSYPFVAREQGITGHVIVEFTVDAEGRVRDPVVIEEQPEGRGFADAALEAVRRFRYVPRLVDGEFVSVPGVRNRIQFDLAP